MHTKETLSGYYNTSIGLLPKTWGVQKLSDIIESLDAGVSVNSDDNPASEIEFGILKTSAVSRGKFKPGENKKIKSDEIHRAKLNPIKNAIIISRMNTPDLVGEVGLVEEDCSHLFLPDRLWQTRYKGMVSGRWLVNILSLPYYRRQIKNMATGTSNSMKNIAKSSFLSMEIPKVSYEEQQKIATILLTWDKAIELKEKLIEQKKEQKKGLMQKLLTGQIRWNDRERHTEELVQERLAMISRGEVPEGYKDTKAGILPEEWMATKLKKISKRVQRKNEGKADKPVLTISSLSGFLNQSDRFSKVIAGENLSKYTLIKKNEFAYNKGNSKTYPCGCVFRLDDYEEALVPNVYYSFQIVEGDTEFYKHYFASGKLNRHLGKVINTGVRNDGLLNLDVNDFFNIPVVCPPKHEQAKIAEILTNAIKVIDYLEREVASIKEQKKGLMQLLLTGRVRVKV